MVHVKFSVSDGRILPFIVPHYSKNDQEETCPNVCFSTSVRNLKKTVFYVLLGDMHEREQHQVQNI